MDRMHASAPDLRKAGRFFARRDGGSYDGRGAWSDELASESIWRV